MSPGRRSRSRGPTTTRRSRRAGGLRRRRRTGTADPIAPDLLLRAAAGALLGLCAGSFVATLARRAPEDWAGLLRGRSACPSCGHRLGPRDLVPLASYLATRGRCRRCGAPIGRYYPLVELAAAAVGAVSFLLAGTAAQALAAAALGWWLLALALIDLRRMELPDALTLPLLTLGLALAAGVALLGPSAPLRAPEPLDALAGAAVGYGGLRALRTAYAALRRREGLGLGDAKLAAAAGAWLGWEPLPPLLLLAALGTLAAALAGALASRRPLRAATALPFGPGLAAAFLALYLWSVAVGPG